MFWLHFLCCICLAAREVVGAPACCRVVGALNVFLRGTEILQSTQKELCHHQCLSKPWASPTLIFTGKIRFQHGNSANKLIKDFHSLNLKKHNVLKTNSRWWQSSIVNLTEIYNLAD